MATIVDYGLIRILKLDVEELRAHAREQPGQLTDAGTQVVSAAPPEASRMDATPALAAESFDVFCCYNSADKAAVKHIAVQLKQRGVKPWLDEWELRPGLPWQDVLQAQIPNIRSVAVFVGKNGIGPWQSIELKAFIDEFARRSCPVIPVLLPECGETPALPPFLRGMTWVDCRASGTDPIARLIWGITGSPINTET